MLLIIYMLECPGSGQAQCFYIWSWQLIDLWACDTRLANESLSWDLSWRYYRKRYNTFFFAGELRWSDVDAELL